MDRVSARRSGPAKAGAGRTTASQLKLADEDSQRLRAAITKAAGVSVWRLEPGARQIVLPPDLRRLLGLNEAVSLTDFCEAATADAREAKAFRSKLDRSRSADAGLVSIDHRPRNHESKPLWLRTTIASSTRPGGRFAIWAVCQNLTEVIANSGLHDRGMEQLVLSTRVAPGFVAMFDIEGRYLAASAGWETICGLARREYVGRRLFEAGQPASEHLHALHGRAAAGEHLVNPEESYIDGAGGVRWMHGEYRPVIGYDGQPTAYHVQGHDITPLMQARQEALDNADRLKLATDAAHAGVFETDFTRQRFWCSPEFEEVLGRSMSFEEFSQKVWPTVHPDDRDGVREAVLRSHTTGAIGPHEFRVTLPTGGSRWIDIRAVVHMGPDGELDKVIGLILDIDARKRQELALIEARQDAQVNADRLKLALGAARAGVFENDMVRRTFWCSPEFVEIVGRALTFDEANNLVWPIIHPDDHDSVLAAATAGIGSLSVGGHESRIILPSGEVRWIDFRAVVQAGPEGQILKLIGLILDVDERKRQELALIEAQRAASAAAEAKSQFLANMSHEIRTPMNGVLGVLHLLNKEPLSADGRRLLDEASACGQMLAQLLNDVIDFSKIEEGHMELTPEPLNAADTLESVVRLLRPQAEAKGLWLKLQVEGCDGWVMADPVRLRQALFNLIGNAVKFTTQGGVEARLLVRAEPSGAKRLRFEIEDTGVGIAHEVQDSLFQRFHQADGSTARQFGGSGLGLAITRALAEIMGGEVGFSSTEGRGSTFWLDVAAPAAERPEVVVQADALCLEGLSVLVVEDNPTNRLVATRILEELGARVQTADDGLLGLEAIQTLPFDLVLMDVQMPRMDGIEATRRIRALSGPASMAPIIGLTANALSHQLSSYADAGMNGVVSKPISPTALVAEIVRVMSAAPSRDEAVA